nr:expressed protein [Hymenolepis microstoma]
MDKPYKYRFPQNDRARPIEITGDVIFESVACMALANPGYYSCANFEFCSLSLFLSTISITQLSDIKFLLLCNDSEDLSLF